MWSAPLTWQEVTISMQTHTGPRPASESGIYILARPPRLWAMPPSVSGTERALGQVPGASDRIILLRAAAEARTALRAAALAAEQAATNARAVAAELDEALAALQSTAPTSESPRGSAPRSGARQRDGLSLREREVLNLVADGLSNKAIAEQLYISPNTVKTHVSSLLNKLDVQTRVQLAALAAKGA
jgi:DNA-binding NarL/FixJ family response regulator